MSDKIKTCETCTHLYPDGTYAGICGLTGAWVSCAYACGSWEQDDESPEEAAINIIVQWWDSLPDE